MKLRIIASLIALCPAPALAQTTTHFWQLPSTSALVGTEIIPLEFPLGGGLYQTRQTTPSAIATFVAAGIFPISNANLAAGAALANIGAGGVTSTYLATGAAQANLGYVPCNVAGCTMTGDLILTAPVATDSSTKAVSSAWVKQFFPSLVTNVQSTGLVGMDMSACATAGACGFMMSSSPTAYPAAADATLRLQKASPASGGTLNSVYDTLNVVGTSGLSDPGSQWAGAFVMYQRTLASAGAGNIAINGTAFKQLNGQAPGTQIGNTWASNFNCTDQTGVVNPTASCAGSEIDINAAVGAGTDSNRQRVGLQIAAGSYNGTDTGVHIGRALLISAQNGVTIDHAIELNDTSSVNHLTTRGTGDSTFNCSLGTWSSGNYSPCVIVTTPGGVNPAFGLFDATNANGWAFRVDYNTGNFEWDTMPALNDAGTGPGKQATLSRTGILAPTGGVQLPVLTIAQTLAITCTGGTNKGLQVHVSDTVGSGPAAFNATVTGGGGTSISRPATCNGSNWVY